ncbi:MAG: beta-propeller domain-containing protein [Methanomassiliicoccales archaeon]|nr:MAG: beta-propeller domain-containing protein [Methanomassiliicoccales archaeon]
MKDGLQKIGAVLIVLFLVTAAVAAVISVKNTGDGLPSGTLPSFETKGQLMDFIRSKGPGRSDQVKLSGPYDAEDSGSNYHTGTNVQVSGVDEIDRIKTDGAFVYIASSDRVSIVLAYPSSSMSNVSEVLIDDILGVKESYSSILGIYLFGGMLILICDTFSYQDGHWPMDGKYWAPSKAMTVAVAVDVSDPYSPKVMKNAGVGGFSVGSRLIEDRLYIISQDPIWNKDRIDLPRIMVDGDVRELSAKDVRFDPDCTRVSTFTNFLVMDIADMSVNCTSILTDVSSTLYVSAMNIYLAFVEWRWDLSTWGAEDAAVSSDSSEVFTKIFKIDISGGDIRPVAMGKVDGYPLNQFSMDENDGLLRIATCSGWAHRENMVFVLDEGMEVIGSLRGIAINETIQSARFIGDTLYLVTFLLTDPLFVIDLSDPGGPKVLGELVLPGFSTYLHPVGDSLLVGIGLEDWTLKVSLFDVSDPTAPIEKGKVMANINAWSSALWDHKAVMFDDRHHLLAIPVFSFDEGTMTSSEEVLVFSVGTEGLDLVARLSNGEGESSPRSMVIEDTFYTITTTSMVAWSISGFEMVGKLVFAEDSADVWYHWAVEDGAIVR